jgi:hypothetical protein
MRYWYLRNLSGEVAYRQGDVGRRAAKFGLGAGWKTVHEMPRALRAGEHWNPEARAIEPDITGALEAIDRAHGAAQIAADHIRKAVEAQRYRATGGEGDGVEWSMLGDEAARTGRPLPDLVATVLERDAAARSANANRIIAKATLRTNAEVAMPTTVPSLIGPASTPST